MDKKCPYVPKQGINKGIRCDKKIGKNDYCGNHIPAVININLKHNCPFIYKMGKNKGKVCNKLIHVRFEMCNKHKQRMSYEEKREYYKNNREAFIENQKRYYRKNIKIIKERLKKYYVENKMKYLDKSRMTYEFKHMSNYKRDQLAIRQKKYYDSHREEILEQKRLKRGGPIKKIDDKDETDEFELSTILEFD